MKGGDGTSHIDWSNYCGLNRTVFNILHVLTMADAINERRSGE